MKTNVVERIRTVEQRINQIQDRLKTYLPEEPIYGKLCGEQDALKSELSWLKQAEAELRAKLEKCVVDKRKVSNELSLYNEGRRDTIKEILGESGP